METGGVTFDAGCDVLLQPPRACTSMKCYNCGNTLLAENYVGLADLIRERDARKDEIVAIYEKHNPEKLRIVDALLEEWVGEEAVLLAKIRHKYIIPPTPPTPPPAPRYRSVATGVIRAEVDRMSIKLGKLEPGEIIAAEAIVEESVDGRGEVLYEKDQQVIERHGLEGAQVRIRYEAGWVSNIAKSGKPLLELLPPELSAGAKALPSWLQPTTEQLLEQSRLTRTGDYLGMHSSFHEGHLHEERRDEETDVVREVGGCYLRCCRPLLDCCCRRDLVEALTEPEPEPEPDFVLPTSEARKTHGRRGAGGGAAMRMQGSGSGRHLTPLFVLPTGREMVTQPEEGLEELEEEEEEEQVAQEPEPEATG